MCQKVKPKNVETQTKFLPMLKILIVVAFLLMTRSCVMQDLLLWFKQRHIYQSLMDSDTLIRKIYKEQNVMTDNISCPTHFPKDKTEDKVDSLNIYCENTLSQQGIHEELFTFTIYSIPQNQVICTT